MLFQYKRSCYIQSSSNYCPHVLGCAAPTMEIHKTYFFWGVSIWKQVVLSLCLRSSCVLFCDNILKRDVYFSHVERSLQIFRLFADVLQKRVWTDKSKERVQTNRYRELQRNETSCECVLRRKIFDVQWFNFTWCYSWFEYEAWFFHSISHPLFLSEGWCSNPRRFWNDTTLPVVLEIALWQSLPNIRDCWWSN